MTGVLIRNGHVKTEIQREGRVKRKTGVMHLQAKGRHELPRNHLRLGKGFTGSLPTP